MGKATIPTKERILGIWYKVLVVGDSDDRLQGEDALVDHIKKAIYISASPSAETPQLKLLYHEIGHALLYETGVRYLDEHLEHVIVEAIQDYMYDKFAD